MQPSPSAQRHYQLIERAIAYLVRHYRQQPELAEVAAQVHLSPQHFQRLFTQWAGISPKRFVQHLTREELKARLRGAASLAEAAEAAGLSGPSRLHDLFVTLDAVTPAEYRSGGAGIEITWGIHPTPFGDCLLASTARGICSLQFIGDGEAAALAELQDQWPRADIQHAPQHTAPLAARAFALAGALDGARGSLSVLVKGSNFQLRVWQALLSVPEGALSSYRGLAEAIGQPGAARAVGAAVGSNPVAYLIPCHRVIRAEGVIGGYRWGAARKAALIGWESAQNPQDLC